MNKTVSYIALARLFAPILVLLYGALALLGMFTSFAPAIQSMDPISVRVQMLVSGLIIIWNALYKGLLVMGAVEVLFCMMTLRVNPKDRFSMFGELLGGEPVGFLWKRLDSWLKLNGAVLLVMGLLAIANMVYTLGNLPAQQNATLLLYARAVLSGLRGFAVQIVWASVFLGLGDIVFRLRRAVYRPTQPAA